MPEHTLVLREPLSFFQENETTINIYEFGEPSVQIRCRYPQRVSQALDRLRAGEPREAVVQALGNDAKAESFLDGLLSRRIVVPKTEIGDFPDRYDRQLRYFGRFSEGSASEYQRRLSAARVVVLGLGGAGAMVAHGLVAAGVGTLVLVDKDRVEESNLNRHVLATSGDIGLKKTDVCRRRLLDLSPTTTLETEELWIDDADELEPLLQGADLCICSADSPPVVLRRIVNRAAAATGVPVLFFGAWRVGPLIVPGRTACWECAEHLAREHDRNWDAKIEHFKIPAAPPSTVAVPTVSGSMAGYDALRHLAGFEEPASLERIIHLDPTRFETSAIQLSRHPGCTTCREKGDL